MNFGSKRRRGSLLIVAMLFSAIIAIGLTSYLTMANNALKLAQRSFLANDAMNLAESGVEVAMSAINSNSWSSPWTISSGNATGTFSGFTYSQGAAGSVQVFVQNYSTTNPVVVAKATITPSQGAPIEKWVMVSGIIERSLFSKGLVGKNGLTFHGNNPSVDSWNSLCNDDGTSRATPVDYSAAVAHDKGSIAAVNVNATAAVMNADIWGTASVGSDSADTVNVGPQGRVGPYGTANGVKNPAYISTNFTTNLPTITAPSPAAASTNTIGANISASLTLPRAGDVSVVDADTGDTIYYYKFPALTGGMLTISPDTKVVLLPTAGAGTSAINLSGNGEGITVGSGANLSIYTPANISMSGKAVIGNANGTAESNSIQIWGTNTSATPPGQSITITGNGNLTCTCYAPNASIDAKGGGNSGAIYGALVGYTINLSGNDAFHYDEALGMLGGAGTFGPTKWVELVKASDRAAYAAHF